MSKKINLNLKILIYQLIHVILIMSTIPCLEMAKARIHASLLCTVLVLSIRKSKIQLLTQHLSIL